MGEVAINTVNEMVAKVKDEDPVNSYWHIPKTKKGIVWCNASSIAFGTVLEIDRKVVEDAAYLKKTDDLSHINVAELESVLKTVNLALKRELQELKVKTDSATVCG